MAIVTGYGGGNAGLSARGLQLAYMNSQTVASATVFNLGYVI